MNLIYKTIFYLFTSIYLGACAQQSSPMGGPKDEDPPILLESSPQDQSTNIKPKEINLTFNEFVQLENPNQQIIITPKINTDEVEFLAIKNKINIKLNQELEDSTTYVLNFQNSIQDITESNPTERLKLVFSTGNTIDSLKITGTVAYVFPQQNDDMENIIVGLYDVADTLDLFTDAPYYLSQADSSGYFEITNIKAGTFYLSAWYDENNSLKAEYRSEAYGFLNDSIYINENKSNIHINLFRADLSPLKINRSAPSGSNYDIILSKPIIEYELIHEDLDNSLFHRLSDKSIRLYHTEITNDSTSVRIILKDSVGFSIDTTLMAKFLPSERTREELEISSNSGTKFLTEINSILTLNKPLLNIKYDSLYLSYDSSGIIPINSNNIQLKDSTKRKELLININIPDSIKNNSFVLNAADSTFQDVEGIWNVNPLEATYTRLNQENLGDGIEGTILTNERPILVQLLDKNQKVLEEKYLENTNYYKFTKMEAGDYIIRAIIDRNRNRRWDVGNYHEKRQPEPVYYFFDDQTLSKIITLRGRWTLDEHDIQPRPDSGINQEVDLIVNPEIEGIPKSILNIREKDLE